jgi:hypothetical protein
MPKGAANSPFLTDCYSFSPQFAAARRRLPKFTLPAKARGLARCSRQETANVDTRDKAVLFQLLN